MRSPVLEMSVPALWLAGLTAALLAGCVVWTVILFRRDREEFHKGVFATLASGLLASAVALAQAMGPPPGAEPSPATKDPAALARADTPRSAPPVDSFRPAPPSGAPAGDGQGAPAPSPGRTWSRCEGVDSVPRDPARGRPPVAVRVTVEGASLTDAEREGLRARLARELGGVPLPAETEVALTAVALEETGGFLPSVTLSLSWERRTGGRDTPGAATVRGRSWSLPRARSEAVACAAAGAAAAIWNQL